MSDTVSRKIHKALKVRLYPSEEQKMILYKTFGCCRVVYNERLSEHINYYNTYKDSPSKPKFKRTLPKELREKKYPWLNEGTIAEALIQSQRNCEQAYSNFFKSLKKQRKGKKVGYPKFKSKKSHKDSFTLCMIREKDLVDFDSRTIFIPKLRDTKFRIANSSLKSKWIEWFMEATPLNMTVSRNACGEYYCSILFEREQDLKQSIRLSNSTGLDFSPNSLYVDSNNNTAPNYKPYKQLNSKKLAKLQRNLVRKQKGSNNREKARVKLARFEKHISDSRKDYIEKETLRLVRTYDVIGIEGLNLQGMMKFSHNAKNYVDTSWYTFTQKLIWKSQFNNCIIVKSDRFYPSSKTCNHCGYVNSKLTLKDRKWICPSCGIEIIRDQNAGKNLRDNAINLLIEEINSVLGMERTEVMSMEDMEAAYFNGMLSGVSCEVENQSSDASKRSSSVFS
jgi:putative transposase